MVNLFVSCHITAVNGIHVEAAEVKGFLKGQLTQHCCLPPSAPPTHTSYISIRNGKRGHSLAWYPAAVSFISTLTHFLPVFRPSFLPFFHRNTFRGPMEVKGSNCWETAIEPLQLTQSLRPPFLSPAASVSPSSMLKPSRSFNVSRLCSSLLSFFPPSFSSSANQWSISLWASTAGKSDSELHCVSMCLFVRARAYRQQSPALSWGRLQGLPPWGTAEIEFIIQEEWLPAVGRETWRAILSVLWLLQPDCPLGTSTKYCKGQIL